MEFYSVAVTFTFLLKSVWQKLKING